MGVRTMKNHLRHSADDYDIARDRELANTDLRALEGKVIDRAMVEQRHLSIVTKDGFVARFYGLLEIVSPGGPSIYDRSEADD